MQPFSLSPACIDLQSTIKELSEIVEASPRRVDLDPDHLAEELSSLAETVEALHAIDKTWLDTQAPAPETLVRIISGIVHNCDITLLDVQVILERHKVPSLPSAVSRKQPGRTDLVQLLNNLSDHKSALRIGLHLLETFEGTKARSGTTLSSTNNSALSVVRQELYDLGTSVQEAVFSSPTPLPAASRLLELLDHIFKETGPGIGTDSSLPSESRTDRGEPATEEKSISLSSGPMADGLEPDAELSTASGHDIESFPSGERPTGPSPIGSPTPLLSRLSSVSSLSDTTPYPSSAASNDLQAVERVHGPSQQQEVNPIPRPEEPKPAPGPLSPILDEAHISAAESQTEQGVTRLPIDPGWTHQDQGHTAHDQQLEGEHPQREQQGGNRRSWGQEKRGRPPSEDEETTTHGRTANSLRPSRKRFRQQGDGTNHRSADEESVWSQRSEYAREDGRQTPRRLEYGGEETGGTIQSTGAELVPYGRSDRRGDVSREPTTQPSTEGGNERWAVVPYRGETTTAQDIDGRGEPQAQNSLQRRHISRAVARNRSLSHGDMDGGPGRLPSSEKRRIEPQVEEKTDRSLVVWDSPSAPQPETPSGGFQVQIPLASRDVGWDVVSPGGQGAAPLYPQPYGEPPRRPRRRREDPPSPPQRPNRAVIPLPRIGGRDEPGHREQERRHSTLTWHEPPEGAERVAPRPLSEAGSNAPPRRQGTPHQPAAEEANSSENRRDTGYERRPPPLSELPRSASAKPEHEGQEEKPVIVINNNHQATHVDIHLPYPSIGTGSSTTAGDVKPKAPTPPPAVPSHAQPAPTDDPMHQQRQPAPLAPMEIPSQPTAMTPMEIDADESPDKPDKGRARQFVDDYVCCFCGCPCCDKLSSTLRCVVM